jgi:hypothetical protein
MTHSLRLYTRLLALYPADLRRDFGAEMALVFADDLETARRDAGMRGVWRVWRVALCECVRFALPELASHAVVRVSAVYFLMSTVVMAGEMYLAFSHHGLPTTPLRAVAAALMMPVMSTPMLAGLLMVLMRGSRLVSLGLSRPEDEER